MPIARRTCRICDNEFLGEVLCCPHCGTAVLKADWGSVAPQTYRRPRWVVARLLAFAIVFGLGGLHRLYVGRYVSGLLQLFSLGGLLVWQLVDIHRLGDNEIADRYGLPLKD